MTIAIASDHAGFALKEKIKIFLADKDYLCKDIGPFTNKSVDYPFFAKELGLVVSRKEVDFGILICGSGVGVSIVANKIKGVRAVLCQDEYVAALSREHNNCNVIAFGEKIITEAKALRCLEIFLGTAYSGDSRHEKRINQITMIDESKDENHKTH